MTGPDRAVLLLPASADRQEWLQTRRGGIGSSDIADILGVGYKTILHVYYDKIGELPLDDDAGEPALWGNLHEETVAREWARRNKSVIRRVGIVGRVDHPWMRCTLDRRVVKCPLPGAAPGTRCCLEVKTRNAWVAGKWRTGVPDDVHAQGVWQRAVTGFDHVHVACLIGGNDYRQYTIYHDPPLEADVIAAGQKLWDHVRRRIPPTEIPEQTNPDRLVELDNRLHPNRAGTRRLSNREVMAVIEQLAGYTGWSVREGEAKREKTRAKAGLVAALNGGDAAVADEELLYTYDEVNTARQCDYEKLLEQWPDAYAACVRQPTTRTIRIRYKGAQEFDRHTEA
jgi:putative phage-type endonuclease